MNVNWWLWLLHEQESVDMRDKEYVEKIDDITSGHIEVMQTMMVGVDVYWYWQVHIVPIMTYAVCMHLCPRFGKRSHLILQIYIDKQYGNQVISSF